MASAHLEDAERLDLPSRKARAGKSFGEEFPVDRMIGPKKFRKEPRVGDDGRVLSGVADFFGNRESRCSRFGTTGVLHLGFVRGAFGFDSVQPVVAQLFPTLPNGYNSFYLRLAYLSIGSAALS